MQAEEAIVFSSGFVTNLATISALVGRGDCIIGDQWNHASIMDGCRMSGAEFLEFKHNNMDALAECLEKTQGRRTLVVLDAVFSMDGDIVDLPAAVDAVQETPGPAHGRRSAQPGRARENGPRRAGALRSAPE